ncbi:hypothetical protein FJY71_03120, partial [candidate division WOR-3 bacterium]|nr:hypothetical protein [candidate division WOR-3 bacterium]
MRWLTVVGLLAASAAGFLPQSFRLQSTAGVWYDDYDLMFDPALLLDVDGHRIYTNLSNYVTGSEAQFG